MQSRATGSAMRRGEIRLANLDPVLGSEASKRRPVVIISNDRANRTVERLGRGMVTVVPLTSNTQRVLSFHVAIPAEESGLDVDSKAQAEHVGALDGRRLGASVGRLPPGRLAEIDAALRLHLDL